MLLPGKIKHLSLFPTPGVSLRGAQRSQYHVPVGTGTDLIKKKGLSKAALTPALVHIADLSVLPWLTGNNPSALQVREGGGKTRLAVPFPLSPSKAELTLQRRKPGTGKGNKSPSVLLQPEKPCCKPTWDASQATRMRKRQEPGSPPPPSFVPFVRVHGAYGAGRADGERGGSSPCACTDGLGGWDGDLPWGRWPYPEQAPLGAEAVPCDMVGTDLLWAPGVAVTPNLLWDLRGCLTPNLPWAPGVAVTPNLPWAPGVAVTPDLPRTPGVAARPPAIALHPTALCIHRSSSLPLPQGRCLFDYLIYQAFIC